MAAQQCVTGLQHRSWLWQTSYKKANCWVYIYIYINVDTCPTLIHVQQNCQILKYFHTILSVACDPGLTSCFTYRNSSLVATLPHSLYFQRAALTLVPETRSPLQPRTLEICQWHLGFQSPPWPRSFLPAAVGVLKLDIHLYRKSLVSSRFVCSLMMKPCNFQTYNEHIESACMLHILDGQ